METAHERQETPLEEEIRMLAGVARNALGRDVYQDRMVGFVQGLKEKYPDYQNRRAYHVLAGSTIMAERESEAIDEDFPGEDSVIGFLQSLL